MTEIRSTIITKFTNLYSNSNTNNSELSDVINNKLKETLYEKISEGLDVLDFSNENQEENAVREKAEAKIATLDLTEDQKNTLRKKVDEEIEYYKNNKKNIPFDNLENYILNCVIDSFVHANQIKSVMSTFSNMLQDKANQEENAVREKAEAKIATLDLTEDQKNTLRKQVDEEIEYYKNNKKNIPFDNLEDYILNCVIDGFVYANQIKSVMSTFNNMFQDKAGRYFS